MFCIFTSITVSLLALVTTGCWSFLLDPSGSNCTHAGSNEELLTCLIQQNHHDVMDLKASIANLISMKSNLSLPTIRNSSCPAIVDFSVQLSNDLFTSTSPVKFDKVISNHGNVYDLSTGKFRAPCDGTYVFSLLTAAEPTFHTNVYIIKDHTRIAYALAIGANHWKHATTVTTTSLKVGESVWVNVDDSMAGIRNNSQFSGTLLREA